MIVTHFGRQHFKIQHGDLVLAFNPVSKESSEKQNKYGADLVLISTDLPDFNGKENCEQGGRKPFVLNGPGEYEVHNIFIRGFGTFLTLPISQKNKEKINLQNTSYLLTIDSLKILYLGCFRGELDPLHREMIDEVDILFLPVSSQGETLDASEAHKLATRLEPKMILPMDYDETSLKIFLKEAGQEKIEKVEKLTIKKKDLESKAGEVVLFSF